MAVIATFYEIRQLRRAGSCGRFADEGSDHSALILGDAFAHVLVIMPFHRIRTVIRELRVEPCMERRD